MGSYMSMHFSTGVFTRTNSMFHVWISMVRTFETPYRCWPILQVVSATEKAVVEMEQRPSPSSSNATAVRESLFAARSRRKAAKAATTSATANEAAAIQESLSRTQQLLQSELSRVSAVQTAIDDDEKLLRKTLDTQKSMNVKGAKKALTALERAKQHEDRMLGLSVLFFSSVVFYIWWCRIIIRLPFVKTLVENIPVLLDEFWNGWTERGQAN